MQLILFAQTLFGMWFVIRTLQIFRARALLETPIITKTGTVFVFTLLLIAFFCAFQPVSCAILIFCVLIFNFLALIVLERQKVDALKREFPIFLDRWILNIKLGNSAARARELSLAAQSERFLALMKPIFMVQNVSNLGQQHVFLSSSQLFDLDAIVREPHLARSRLEFMRMSIRKAEDFRRKSGQAVRQTRIQAVVMVIMLFALSCLVYSRFGFRRMGDLIFIAWLLTFVGISVMMLQARKTKWKI